MFSSFFKREPRTSSSVLCQYTEFQKQSVKIIMEDKQRGMFSSFFKREPRTNNTLCTYTEFQKPSVKIIMEDNQRGMFFSFFKREPRTNSTLPIHRISKAISENNHGG